MAEHYLLTEDYVDPRSRGLAVYTWDFIVPTCNTFCCISDLIIAAMTIDRLLSILLLNANLASLLNYNLIISKCNGNFHKNLQYITNNTE